MKKLVLLLVTLLLCTNSGKAQHSISGYVVSLETAKPIANATIFLNDKYGLSLEDSLRVTSDSTGFYRISGIEAGTYIINAWTTYRAMNQLYAMVIQSDRIDVDRNQTIDFVFSENAFKFRLHIISQLWDVYDKPKRSSDSVARKAVRPQIYINSEKEPIGVTFIEKIKDF